MDVLVTNGSLLYRAWYYFRLGYGTYVTFPFSLVSFIVTTYYLAIKNIPDLEILFPHMYIFVVFTLVVAGPISVAFGWFHVKRSRIYSVEAEIGYEANPYVYRLPAGYWKDAFAPFFREQLRLTRLLCARENLLDAEDTARLQEIEGKLQLLLEGDAVGVPKGRGARDHLKKSA